MILILSNPKEDVHIAPVAAELERRGEEYCVFDPASYPSASSITMDGRQSEVKTTIGFGEKSFILSTVKSVWYRRPGDCNLSDQLRPEEADWLRSECDHFLRAIWQNTDSLWVSNPAAIRSASLKGVQLRLAKQMGFLVPDFIVTNDVDQAAGFVAQNESGVVVKALGKPAIRSGNRIATLYTHLLGKEDLCHLGAVKNGPTFLQQYIDKSEDVRVTVIGRAAFAVSIRPNKAAKTDFRKVEIYDLPHSIIQLPPHLSELCVRLVERLGLAFGAIDIAVTPSGDYYFLEINPNGQWAWLEYVTGLPLAAAMCDLLAQREKNA